MRPTAADSRREHPSHKRPATTQARPNVAAQARPLDGRRRAEDASTAPPTIIASQRRSIVCSRSIRVQTDGPRAGVRLIDGISSWIYKWRTADNKNGVPPTNGVLPHNRRTAVIGFLTAVVIYNTDETDEPRCGSNLSRRNRADFFSRGYTSGQNSSHRLPANLPRKPSRLLSAVWPGVVALGGSQAFSITLFSVLPATLAHAGLKRPSVRGASTTVVMAYRVRDQMPLRREGW